MEVRVTAMGCVCALVWWCTVLLWGVCVCTGVMVYSPAMGCVCALVWWCTVLLWGVCVHWCDGVQSCYGVCTLSFRCTLFTIIYCFLVYYYLILRFFKKASSCSYTVLGNFFLLSLSLFLVRSLICWIFVCGFLAFLSFLIYFWPVKLSLCTMPNSFRIQ